jgi:hypothetical protein
VANIYEIKKQFDDALTNAGYAVNDGLIASTDDFYNGVKIYTDLSEIEDTDEQVGEHLTIEFDYNLQFVRALFNDGSEAEKEARRIQSGQDWETILAVLYKQINGRNTAEVITIDNGSLRPDTAKDYQSWGDVILKLQHKFRVCLPTDVEPEVFNFAIDTNGVLAQDTNLDFAVGGS